MRLLNKEEIVHFKTNREKKLTPQCGLYWCWKCDSRIVGIGEKCKCGATPAKKTLKKEPGKE